MAGNQQQPGICPDPRCSRSVLECVSWQKLHASAIHQLLIADWLTQVSPSQFCCQCSQAFCVAASYSSLRRLVETFTPVRSDARPRICEPLARDHKNFPLLRPKNSLHSQIKQHSAHRFDL